MSKVSLTKHHSYLGEANTAHQVIAHSRAAGGGVYDSVGTAVPVYARSAR